MSDTVVEAIQDGLGDKIQNLNVHSDRRVYIDVAPDDIQHVARFLWDTLKGRYAIASGLDTAHGFEVLHHFAFDEDHVLVTVRTFAQGDPPTLDSLAPMIKGAAFIEREMHDLLGIEFRGHPNLTRLLLSDDWPEGVYPLRRGRPWEGKVRKPV